MSSVEKAVARVKKEIKEDKSQTFAIPAEISKLFKEQVAKAKLLEAEARSLMKKLQVIKKEGRRMILVREKLWAKLKKQLSLSEDTHLKPNKDWTKVWVIVNPPLSRILEIGLEEFLKNKIEE